MSTPKLVKFWAEWCAPCHRLEPIVAELEREFADQLEVVRVNVDEHAEMATMWCVTSLPTLLLVDGASDVPIADLTPVAFRKAELRNALEQALALLR